MRLKPYLAKAGITQKEFAERAGLTPVTLSIIINTDRIPDTFTINKIFRASDGEVGIDDWIGPDGTKVSQKIAT